MEGRLYRTEREEAQEQIPGVRQNVTGTTDDLSPSRPQPGLDLQGNV